MKTLLRATVAAITLLGAGAALAADFSKKGLLPPAPELPTFYNWSGVYLGGQVGYSWGSDRASEFATAGRAPLGRSFDYSPSSFIGGARVGFNYQLGSIVVGVEGDIEGVNAHEGKGDLGGTVRVRQDWQGSVRARLGYSLDRIMVYATGGVAFTKLEYAYVSPLAGLTETINSSRTGWTVGGGVDYAVTDNIILGVDYRYSDYGRFDHVGLSAYLGRTVEHEPSAHAVRASLAYKF
ncbi:porin family protein [Bosea vestrisii]|uniref:outer membrane protein n=1 Tax=Bosea vestrisii TaxID=151416 RepID=UPI0024DF5DEA|nr:outer membrane protein [Bosea vestrisii]WID98791.1 porin family protein [Bosea vestrisii]